MVWIDLAQDRDRWRYLVNVVMNVGLHKMRGISLLRTLLISVTSNNSMADGRTCEAGGR